MTDLGETPVIKADVRVHTSPTQKGKSEAAAAPVSPITVLEILSRQPQRAMAMADLEELSGMDSTRFRSVLKGLMDLAYL